MAEKYVYLRLPIAIDDEDDRDCAYACSQMRSGVCLLGPTRLKLDCESGKYKRSRACIEAEAGTELEIDPACSVIVVKKD
jgi:hypothetical protein